jgi:glycerophosphoryl diester phosphodiesterase
METLEPRLLLGGTDPLQAAVLPEPPGPDLVATACWTNLPSPAAAGDVALYRITLVNDGTRAASAPVTVQTWGSADGEIAVGDDVLLCSTRQYLYLPPGVSTYVYGVGFVPRDVPEGVLETVVAVDAAGDVDETPPGETNNVCRLPGEFRFGRPDLVGRLGINGLGGPRTTGDVGVLEVRVGNEGSVLARGMMSVEVWASADGDLASGGEDLLLGRARTYAWVPPEGVMSVPVVATVPATSLAGACDLVVVVDADDEVVETATGETNNETVAADALTLGRPNLVASFGPLTTPPPGTPGGMALFDLRVVNRGNVRAAGPLTIRLRLDPQDAETGTDDHLVGSVCPYVYLPPGASLCYPVVMRVPDPGTDAGPGAAGTAFGSYRLVMNVDAACVFAESDETDNTVDIPDYIVIAPPPVPVSSALPAMTHDDLSGSPVQAILAVFDDPQDDTVLVTAHRGAHSDAPENSLAAVRRAIEMGVDIVELDVQRTRDGGLVLMHDATVDRTTNGHGLVSVMTLAEVRALRLRTPDGTLTDERVPTLEEAMRLVRGYCMVDLDKAWRYLDEVCDVLVETDTLDHAIVVTARDAASLQRTLDGRETAPVCMPWVGSAAVLADVRRTLSPRVVEVVFASDMQAVISAESVGATRAGGARVWVNTMFAWECGGHCDRLARADADGAWGWLVDRGVGVVQTDDPASLLAYLRRRGLHR